MTQLETLTKEDALKRANDGQNQDIKSRFVAQHVFCNINSLAEYCLSKGWEDPDSPINIDDIENFHLFPEWSQKLLGDDLFFEGGHQKEKEDFLENFDRLISESEDLLSKGEISEETHERNVSLVDEARNEFEDLETEMADVFEWWAISGFLYDRLLENGYTVIDSGSCYVWGRQCTGQAILLDYSISEICADMEILEGQVNSWAK